jgi:excisionase family DNA binding protein
MDALLTVQEVSQLTGLSVGTLYHWVSQRRIPFVRLSARCIRFRRSDLEAWIGGMLQAPASSNEGFMTRGKKRPRREKSSPRKYRVYDEAQMG